MPTDARIDHRTTQIDGFGSRQIYLRCPSEAEWERQESQRYDNTENGTGPALTSGLGSLLDKTLRIEMDNPIFRKLQEAVEQPCRSREWFGLAEQVINTVYALGEHPDIFGDDLIKKLSIRAFTKRQKSVPEAQDQETNLEKDPDAMNEDETEEPSQTKNDSTQKSSSPDDKDFGDAFELSQLLFVVGHVAIKHIVYLELVERELKRQKDERRAGKSTFFIEFRSLTFFSQLRKEGRQIKQQRTRMAKSLTK